MRIKKGDKVQVLVGKDSGKTGKVLRVLPKASRVSVAGVNLLYKNMRPRKQGEKGQRIQFPGSLPIANVGLVCPKCGKVTRIGAKVLENGSRVRMCAKCHEVIS